MDSMGLKERLSLALEIATEAGRLTLAHFCREDLVVERKGDDSPVTVADREAEAHMRRRIAASFPDDSVLGEEMGESAGTSGWRWILDPIDGTKSFIHGVPLFGTLIGVKLEGRPQLGVIHLPALEETVYAMRGGGAWWSRPGAEECPARVSSCARLAEGLFTTTSTTTYERLGRRAVYDALQARAGLTRSWGDCYGYALVATGRAEVMIDPRMAVWDAAAMLPILEEAGGTFTDWNGVARVDGGEGIATNGLVLDEVLAVTRGK
jgi:histidinol phosphatase-like enzyme (inositol monophosphatase family)